MKAMEWRHYLESEQRGSGKTVFTVAELANVASTTAHAMNVEIGRLMKAGVIARYAHGRYGLPGAAVLEDVLPQIDSSAYATGHWVLHRANHIDQRPSVVTCFTARRHNRSRLRDTPLGRLVFSTVAPPIYSPPASGAPMASSEQALCDLVYLCLRQGLRPESLVRFRRLDQLSGQRLEELLASYPGTVRTMVEEMRGGSE